MWSALQGSLWLYSGSLSLMLTVKVYPACCFLDKTCKPVILPQPQGTAKASLKLLGFGSFPSRDSFIDFTLDCL